MEVPIEARQLTRRFNDLVAVNEVSFEVRMGEVFGFLGPNGAGKTTTVRMLTGVLEPTAGTAMLDGYDVCRHPVTARKRMASVPEDANIYVDLTVWQNAMLTAALYRIPRRTGEEKAIELLRAFGLFERKNEKGYELSKGLKRRLMLCMALVSNPAILFLDEPTGGLDVVSARMIREEIRKMSKQGLTVFLTTHNIAEAEQLCSRVAIINNGRIAAIDTPEALKAKIVETCAVELKFEGSSLREEEIQEVEEVREVRKTESGYLIYTRYPGRVAQRLGCLASEKGLQIRSINTLGPDLEEVFVQITGSDSKHARSGGDA